MREIKLRAEAHIEEVESAGIVYDRLREPRV
jgi:hypothetical protein